MMLYSREKNRFALLCDMFDCMQTVSGDFHFTGPHTLVATTWRQAGSLDSNLAITVNLEDAFDKIPPSSD